MFRGAIKFVLPGRRGNSFPMKEPNIEQRGKFARLPRDPRPAPALHSIETTILQSLARGQEAIVSRSAVSRALNADAETDDLAVTGWAEQMARQHRVRWTRPSLREILFALHDRE